MEASTSTSASASHSLDRDLLSIIFKRLDPSDLVRCSAVCKSWFKAVYTSNVSDVLCNKDSIFLDFSGNSISTYTPLKNYFLDYATEKHKLSLISGFAEINHLMAHSLRFDHCRSRRGLIVTGVGDKVMRLWSSQNLRCIGEYPVPPPNNLVDFDFDDIKIVGLVSSSICIWRRYGRRSMFPSGKGVLARGLCLGYSDPEAMVGCDDGTVRVYDMYSQRCSRILRMHAGPVTCMSLSEDMIISGSSLGSISISGLHVDQRVMSLRCSSVPVGIKTISFNARSYLLFAGLTNGFAHCWDMRTWRLLWQARISPNVVYSMDQMFGDTSLLVAGGIDGVLRIVSQNTGETAACYVLDENVTMPSKSHSKLGSLKKLKMQKMEDVNIDGIPRRLRPPITCVSVGMQKVATAHNDKYLNIWKFSN